MKLLAPGVRIPFRTVGGGRRRSVLVQKGPCFIKKQEVDGWTDGQHIRVSGTIGDQRRREVLFHELVHDSLLPVVPATGEEAFEETITKTLEANMFHLLRVNPALVVAIWPEVIELIQRKGLSQEKPNE